MRYALTLTRSLALILTLSACLWACDDPAADPTCAQDCTATGQVCDTPTLTCVQCRFPADCDDGQTCSNTVCVPDVAPPCTNDDQCIGQPHPFCSSLKLCEWDCTEPAHCTTAPNTLCDPESHTCISTSTSSGADVVTSDTNTSDASDASTESDTAIESDTSGATTDATNADTTDATNADADTTNPDATDPDAP